MATKWEARQKLWRDKRQQNQNTRETKTAINTSKLTAAQKKSLRIANRQQNRSTKWTARDAFTNKNKNTVGGSFAYNRSQKLTGKAADNLKNSKTGVTTDNLKAAQLDPNKDNLKNKLPQVELPPTPLQQSNKDIASTVGDLEKTMPLSFDKEGKATAKQQRLEQQIKNASLESQRGAANRSQQGGRSRGGAASREQTQIKREEGKGLADAQIAGQEADYNKRQQIANTKLGILQNQDTDIIDPTLNAFGVGIPKTAVNAAGWGGGNTNNVDFGTSRGGAPNAQSSGIKGAPGAVPGQIPAAKPTMAPAQRNGNILGGAQQQQAKNVFGNTPKTPMGQKMANNRQQRLQGKVNLAAGGPGNRILNRLKRR